MFLLRGVPHRLLSLLFRRGRAGAPQPASDPSLSEAKMRRGYSDKMLRPAEDKGAPPVAYDVSGRPYCSACGDSGAGPCAYHATGRWAAMLKGECR